MQRNHSHALLALRNAVGNASNHPLSDTEIVAILRGGHASGSHLRAVFGDVSLRAIAHAGASHGIEMPTILAAYQAARASAAAANPELDRALLPDW